MEKASLKL
jgi:hypothetical protein